MSALIVLRDLSLTRKLIRKILTSDDCQAIGELADSFGWENLKQDIQEFLEVQRIAVGAGSFRLLFDIIGCGPGEVLSETEKLTVCRGFLDFLWTKVANSPKKLLAKDGIFRTPRTDLGKCFKCLYSLSRLDLFDSLAATIISKPTYFPAEAILLPALKEFQLWCGPSVTNISAFVSLAQHCIDAMEKSIPPLPSATDWKQNVGKLTCACATCNDLKAFLQHPAKIEWKLNASQKLRKHTQAQLYGRDVTYRTEGSRTLVWTKNRESHAVQKRKIEESRKTVEDLRLLLFWGKQPPAKKQKIEG